MSIITMPTTMAAINSRTNEPPIVLTMFDSGGFSMSMPISAAHALPKRKEYQTAPKAKKATADTTTASQFRSG